jgi:hypothetical protein
MDGEAILSVSAAVVALTQLVKWSGLPDRQGPGAVMLLSTLGVFLWAISQPGAFDKTQTWAYFVAVVNVALASAGTFGFTRAASSAVTKLTAPPAGAGASPTVDVERREG